MNIKLNCIIAIEAGKLLFSTALVINTTVPAIFILSHHDSDYDFNLAYNNNNNNNKLYIIHVSSSTCLSRNALTHCITL